MMDMATYQPAKEDSVSGASLELQLEWPSEALGYCAFGQVREFRGIKRRC